MEDLTSRSPFALDSKARRLVESAEASLKSRFEELDLLAQKNAWKVLEAFHAEHVAEQHFETTSGYGYTDIGRDTLEKVYARVFHTEDALVRPQIISGTHALAVAVFGLLRPGDEIIFAADKPYDTMQGVIGIRREVGDALEFGITHKLVPLLPDGKIDIPAVVRAIGEKTKVLEIQRSKGYTTRPSFTPEQIGEVIAAAKAKKPDLICMVDNCYGEFVQEKEPTDFGADIAVGSLIKNAGGGLAPIGGYIVGKKELIERCASRLSSPGLGKEAGATLGVLKSLYQGLFMAPTVTMDAVKTAVLSAYVFEKLGYEVQPGPFDPRADIVEAITLRSEEAVLAFCKGVQQSAPVDSYVTPVPWDMPGYGCPIIMAAGAFNSGASIELSADAPIEPPYTVYFQGGLTYAHGKYGVIRTLTTMVESGVLKLPETLS